MWMNSMKRILAALLVLWALISTSAFTQQVRIACVGNSITYGSGIENRDIYAYPAQLQTWMGELYEVRNFGVSGATLLSDGDKPYIKQAAYTDAQGFNPDIVIIKLGTNDSKPQNWKFAAQFETDYKAFIATFRELPSKPRIILALPVPVFTEEKWGIRDSVIKHGVIPAIKNVASETNCETVDLYNALLPYPSFFPDQVHPNALGAEIMVQEIYMQLFHKTGSHGAARLNTATFAVPSPEFRGEAAGWGKGNDWMSQHEAINLIGKSRKVDLVFLGNSITQSWGGEGRSVWSIVPNLWDSLYKPRNAANFGISGDRTQHILWRIANGNFDDINPKVIVLTIGVNNFRQNTAAEIAEGIKEIIRALLMKVPSAHILLLGPFPAGADPSDPMRVKYHEVHQIIRHFGTGKVTYMNIGDAYINADGTLNMKLMRPDNIHLAPEGYYHWASSIESFLKNHGL